MWPVRSNHRRTQFNLAVAAWLSDHFICPHENVRRDRQAERLGGPDGQVTSEAFECRVVECEDEMTQIIEEGVRMSVMDAIPETH